MTNRKILLRGKHSSSIHIAPSYQPRVEMTWKNVSSKESVFLLLPIAQILGFVRLSISRRSTVVCYASFCKSCGSRTPWHSFRRMWCPLCKHCMGLSPKQSRFSEHRRRGRGAHGAQNTQFLKFEVDIEVQDAFLRWSPRVISPLLLLGCNSLVSARMFFSLSRRH